MPRRTRALLLALLAACARAPEDSTVDAVEAVEASEARVVRTDRADLPVAELEPEQLTRFREGDGLFEAVYREVDGLGPAYIRASCSDCHREDGRGPGVVTRVVQTSPIGASLVQAGWSPASPLGDTERPYVTAGATIPLLFPDGPEIRRTQRLPPAVFGRGLLEAIADAEIERLARAAADRDRPVRGRIARVRLPGASEELIGRFGLKAAAPTLTDFTARALHGDMGLTSPLYPEEAPNPEGLTDDAKPGVDVTLEDVELLADYVRMLALPTRTSARGEGARLFEEVGCATCHTPSLRTRPDYPLAAWADVDAFVYTDLLLHDMGDGLADGVREGDAGPREWRTAPLIGLRFLPAYLHDGRAPTIAAAIREHRGPGSEANDAVAAFDALGDEARRALIEFVSGL